MPKINLSPHNDTRIDINEMKKNLITIAFADTDLYRATRIYVGFGDGRGNRNVVLDINVKHMVVDNFPQGTDSLVIRSFGPEPIIISYV